MPVMSAKTARFAISALCLALAAPSLAGEPALTRFEFVETHMGSPFKIVLYTSDEATARQASRAAYERIARLDQLLSDYNPESELMRLCDRAGGPPVAVSDELFDILEQSQAMWRRSQGAFDVTVGPVVRLWRRARRTRKMPDAVSLARALALVGGDKVRLDPSAHTVQLLAAGMKLDLGGIAKGYAAGEAIAVLKRQGIPRALVAGAGDIVVGEAPPDADGWTIGIAPLKAPGTAPSPRFLSLTNVAVSTSGDAEQFVELDGKRYSHIVDPRTGVGLVDRSTVTVVARDGATADGLDTAISVLGPERGIPLVEEIEGTAALMVRATGQGQQSFESKRWPTLPVGRPKEVPAQSPQVP
jgi:thiamine biosynthesis lipoprotein